MGNKKITVKVEIPEGYNLEINGTDCKLVPKLPKTWEEFCAKYPIKDGACLISTNSFIVNGVAGSSRGCWSSQNILPNREIAEAVRALCQLLQLRDLYNGDWEPDWKNTHEKKYVIMVCCDKVEPFRTEAANKVLAFKSEELRDQFLENFRDLIEIAKPLI